MKRRNVAVGSVVMVAALVLGFWVTRSVASVRGREAAAQVSQAEDRSARESQNGASGAGAQNAAGAQQAASSNGQQNDRGGERDKDRERDRQEILKAYESIREAHFKHDAAQFLAPFDEQWYRVSDGDVALRRKEDYRPELQSYLDRMKFNELRELEKPRVEISADGTTAWFIGRVQVRGEQKDEGGYWMPVVFNSAWVDLWKKKPEGWRIVGQANTEKVTLSGSR
jgi:FtsZ-interacting cell division protein ZipA